MRDAEGRMSESQRAERMDLRVRTKQFALRVIRLFLALPKRAEADVNPS
jgi:hypothetical protein